jgi:hypothetical protein
MGRPGAPGASRRAAGVADASVTKRKKDDKERGQEAGPRRAARKPKITVADEVDLREFVGVYQEDTYSDIHLR